MEQLALVFGLAFLVESSTEYFFGTWLEGEWLKLVAVIMGIAIAVGFNVDLLALVGYTSPVPYVGAILTGIILSRGSDFLHQAYNALVGAGKTEVVGDHNIVTTTIDNK